MIPNLRGGQLEDRDYAALAARAIDRAAADRQFLRRVTSVDGAEILGRNGTGNYAGVAIPYVWPGEERVREYRIRRDRPEIENGKEKGKYLAPPGRNLLYIPVGIEPAWLDDASIELVCTEGEFKAISLLGAARRSLNESAALPRFVPIALSGVNGWRGTVGKTSNANGDRVDVKGVISDLSRVEFEDRTVTIIFDRDSGTNDNVRCALKGFTKELQGRGATVKIFAWPKEYPEAKGVDDLIAAAGPQLVLHLISAAKKKAAPKEAKEKNFGPKPGDFLRNDTGNADRLAASHGDNLAHCAERNGYMVHTGPRWEYDEFVLVEALAEKTLRAAFAEAADITDSADRAEFLRFINGSLSKRGLDAMAHLTKKKVRQAPSTEFDKQPFLLNCQNGTVDLRTGQLREHRKDDLISKLIPIRFDPDATAPLFLRFVYRIMGDGPDATVPEQHSAARLACYLQRLFGCAATGKPEKLLAVCHGGGDNGKSTLLAIINKALGDKEYSTQINIESLMVDPKGAGTSNAVNSDLSDLQGCRFVFSSEVGRGQRLALSRVKYLTGLTSVKARRMRENWITFPPTWKIFMDCNDRPIISSPTDAIWNRVKLLPFTVKLSKQEIDTNLLAKLELELPGILAWIVAGARDYLAHGLGDAPAEVDSATAEYQESSDRLKEFIEDRCYLNPYAWVSSARLSSAYTDWCVKNGERSPLDSKSFAEQIKSKSCTPKLKEINRKKVRGWLGIELIEERPIQQDTANPI